MEEQPKWIGPGRWLAFLSSAVLLLIGFMQMFSSGQGAAAGWSIFLALIFAASVGAGSKSAPKLAFGVTALMILRVVLLPFLGGSLGDLLINAIPAILAGFAAIDLRSQQHRTESARTNGLRTDS